MNLNFVVKQVFIVVTTDGSENYPKFVWILYTVVINSETVGSTEHNLIPNDRTATNVCPTISSFSKDGRMPWPLRSIWGDAVNYQRPRISRQSSTVWNFKLNFCSLGALNFKI